MIQKNVLLQRFFPIITFFTITVVVVLDQFIKYKIRFLGGFYICNEGISFGYIIPNILFWLIFGLFFILIVFYAIHLYKKGCFSILFTLSLGFLIGGALSNAFDRATRGCIFDYIIPFWHFLPIFNVADIAISVGATLLILTFLKKNI